MSVKIIGTPLPLVWECPWCRWWNFRANAGEDHCWDCGAIVLTAQTSGAALRVQRTAGPPLSLKGSLCEELWKEANEKIRR